MVWGNLAYKTPNENAVRKIRVCASGLTSTNSDLPSWRTPEADNPSSCESEHSHKLGLSASARWGSSGFTLVETIVACTVAMILIGAVVGILAFSARSMGYQRAQGNAATIASTVKETIEGTLRTSKEVKVEEDSRADGGQVITFNTTQKTSYLGNKDVQYWLYIKDGQLCITNYKDGIGTSPEPSDTEAAADQDDNKNKAGGMLPDKTYIDQDTIGWEITDTSNSPSIKINVYSGQDKTNAIATAQTDIESVNS